jgi:bifunctional non-homologous end joining protein LigD
MPSSRLEVDVDGRTLSLSNLDKVLYPRAGFTKGQVIDYYTRIAPVLLPHLRGRPLTLKRYPNGVESQYFYEKQCPSHRPEWVRTAAIRAGSKVIHFCLCDDLPTLVWAANLADLEIHPSLARAEAYHSPTVVAFDLDPGPPATIVECAEVAVRLRAALRGVGLECFPKTSGSKGMQVYAPLNTPTDYAQVKPFAFAVAKALERAEPDLAVSDMKKSLRVGKVLVDWSQNDEHKTTVCVYSLRARERPTASTPITWDEVEALRRSGDPDDLVFTSDQTLARVAEHGDLFAPVLHAEQALPQL